MNDITEELVSKIDMRVSIYMVRTKQYKRTRLATEYSSNLTNYSDIVHWHIARFIREISGSVISSETEILDPYEYHLSDHVAVRYFIELSEENTYLISEIIKEAHKVSGCPMHVQTGAARTSEEELVHTLTHVVFNSANKYTTFVKFMAALRRGLRNSTLALHH